MATVNNEKRRERIATMVAASKGAEPVLNEENYQSSLYKALNWHNEHTDSKKYRQWAIAAIKKTQPEFVDTFNKASDFEMKYIGIIFYHASKGQYVSEQHRKDTMDRVNALHAKYAATALIQKVKAKVDVDIQQRIHDLAVSVSEEVDYKIDEFILSKNVPTFSMKAHLTSNNASAQVAKKIAEFYKPGLKEIEEAIEGSDPQLKEGYSNFTKTQLKKYKAFLEAVINDCEQQVVTTKKPRAKKQKSPTQLVSKMKYMKESEEFKLKSVNPTEIVGAKEVWIFNTKYRMIQRYVAADASGLSVKGTTLLNYSTSESVGKKLRKPEEYLQNLTKGWLLGQLKKLTTKDSKVNGRINEECIILKAF